MEGCPNCTTAQAELDALHEIITVLPAGNGYLLEIPCLGPEYSVYGDTLSQAVAILMAVVKLQQDAMRQRVQVAEEALRETQDVLDEVKEKRRH